MPTPSRRAAIAAPMVKVQRWTDNREENEKECQKRSYAVRIA
jgi:hypothetical protein